MIQKNLSRVEAVMMQWGKGLPGVQVIVFRLKIQTTKVGVVSENRPRFYFPARASYNRLLSALEGMNHVSTYRDEEQITESYERKWKRII